MTSGLSRGSSVETLPQNVVITSGDDVGIIDLEAGISYRASKETRVVEINGRLVGDLDIKLIGVRAIMIFVGHSTRADEVLSSVRERAYTTMSLKGKTLGGSFTIETCVRDPLRGYDFQGTD